MNDVLHSSRRTVPSTVSLLLLAIPVVIGLVDWLWAEKGGFAFAGHAYMRLALLAGLFWAAGYVYDVWRPEPRLAAMLFGTGFLVAFSAAASVLNAMLLTVANSRIDTLLARADIALGFDWPAMMRAVAGHPDILWILQAAYSVLLPEVALAVVVLGTVDRISSLYRFVLAVAIGALICIFVWTLFPAFGAMSVYHFDSALAARLHVAVDGAYGQALVRMLKDGPGLIAPDNIKGLIGFPSYHVVLALLLIWHFRDLRLLSGLMAGINSLVILATPIEGGHHWVDVFAGLPVALLAVMGADQLYRLTNRWNNSPVVNLAENLTVPSS